VIILRCCIRISRKETLSCPNIWLVKLRNSLLVFLLRTLRRGHLWINSNKILSLLISTGRGWQRKRLDHRLFWLWKNKPANQKNLEELSKNRWIHSHTYLNRQRTPSKMRSRALPPRESLESCLMTKTMKNTIRDITESETIHFRLECPVDLRILRLRVY
jgi:hypothetical protein